MVEEPMDIIDDSYANFLLIQAPHSGNLKMLSSSGIVVQERRCTLYNGGFDNYSELFLGE
jgi:hypothetical protein